MIVAPLMTPMQAMAAAIAFGWGRRLLEQSATVVVSVVGVVGVAWTITALAPGAGLTDEVLARTSPGVLDLIVALASGVAGAYAITREDVSDALPGVAVAVSLAPPLAAVGITLQLGRSDLASGAMLLFTINFLAITISGVVVMLATGFVPWRALRRARRSSLAAFGLIFLATIAAAVPLTRASMSAAEAAQTRQRTTAAVRAWLGEESPLEIDRVTVDGRRVGIVLVGDVPPPPAAELAERVRTIVPGAELDIRWSEQGRLSTEAPSVGDRDAERERAAVRGAVDDWLGDAEGDVEVLATTVDGRQVVVDVIGEVEPPPTALLTDAIARATGRRPEVEVRWLPRVVRAEDATPTATQRRADALYDVVASWASDQGVGILDLQLDDASGTAVLDIAGPDEPDVLALLVAVRSAWSAAPEADAGDLGDEPTLTVRYVPRVQLFGPGS